MAASPEIARANGKKGGRPPGSKNKTTLEREVVLRGIQQRIMEGADILLDRMWHLALGQAYLYKIEKYYVGTGKDRKIKNKKPKLVTKETEIREYLTEIAEGPITHIPEATYYFITTEKPDGRTIEALYNRTFSRSVTPVALTDENGKSVFDDESKEKSKKALAQLLGRKK